MNVNHFYIATVYYVTAFTFCCGLSLGQDPSNTSPLADTDARDVAANIEAILKKAGENKSELLDAIKEC